MKVFIKVCFEVYFCQLATTGELHYEQPHQLLLNVKESKHFIIVLEMRKAKLSSWQIAD